jgi:hypothetical protein
MQLDSSIRSTAISIWLWSCVVVLGLCGKDTYLVCSKEYGDQVHILNPVYPFDILTTLWASFCMYEWRRRNIVNFMKYGERQFSVKTKDLCPFGWVARWDGAASFSESRMESLHSHAREYADLNRILHIIVMFIVLYLCFILFFISRGNARAHT